MLQLSTILFRYLLFGFIIFGANFLAEAQEKKPNVEVFSQADIETLYQQCINVREDTIGRICIGFLNTHHIRRDNVPAFFAFCKAFLNYSNGKGNKIISHRMAIIELQGKLKFDSIELPNPNKAFEDLHEAYINQNDYPAALECLLELGQYFHSINKNIEALQVLFYAEKFAAKYKLEQKISYQGVLHRVGYILWQLDKPYLSIDYLKRSLASGNSLLKDSMICFNALGMNYQKLNSLQQSLYCFTEASRLALADANNVFNTVVQGSAAVTLIQMGDVNKAYLYSMQYKNISVQYPLWDNAVDAFYRLVQIEIMRNNVGHAKILLDSLNGIMGKISSNDFESYKKCKEAAYLYYEMLGQFQLALTAYKEYVHYDSLFQDYSNKNKISELELNASIRLYEEEMQKKEQSRKWQSIITSIGILLALCWGGIYTYQRIHRLKQEKTNIEDLNVAQADEIEQLKKQLLAQLATIREQNISFQALSIQNNNSLSEISNEVTTAQETIDNPIPEGLDKDDSNAQFLNQFNLSKKEQWKDFKDFFSKTYPNFEINIVTKIGTLSPAELRLLMLLKLGLSNKETAETLLITLDGVKKAKYRLYKKVGVTSSEEMKAFLK
jgi:DNA-binding CsgD family transcriptional regulator